MLATQHLAATAAILGILTLFQVLSHQAIVAFLFGIVLGIVLLAGGFVAALLWAEKKAKAGRDAELRSKTENVVADHTYDHGVQIEGLIQLHPPGVTKRSEYWVWGILKENLLLFSTHASDKKATARIVLNGASVVVIKTKPGAVWRRSNFIKISHPENNILGKYKSCVLFLRTPRDMEDWYHRLTRAATISSGSASASRQHTRNYFVEMNTRLGGLIKPGPVDATWLNALSARIFYHLHREPGFMHTFKQKIQHKLDKVSKPSVITSLKVKDLHFGPNFLMFSNVELVSMTPEGEIKIDADVGYHGGFQLVIEMAVDIELMGAHIGTEVRLAVACKKLTGKVHLRMGPVPADRVWFGFYNEPEIDFDIDSLIGQTNPIANIPKLASIIVYKLKQELVEVMVLPDMDDIALPDLPTAKGESKPKLVNWEYIDGLVVPDKLKEKEKAAEAAKPMPSPPLSSQPLPVKSSPITSTKSPESTAGAQKGPAPALPKRRSSAGLPVPDRSPIMEMKSIKRSPNDSDDEVEPEDDGVLEMASWPTRKRAASSGSSLASSSMVEPGPKPSSSSILTPTSERVNKVPLVKEPVASSGASSPALGASSSGFSTPAERADISDNDDLTEDSFTSIFNQSTGQTLNPFVSKTPETSDPLGALAKISGTPSSSAWSAFESTPNDDFVVGTAASRAIPAPQLPARTPASTSLTAPVTTQSYSTGAPNQTYTAVSVPKDATPPTTNPFIYQPPFSYSASSSSAATAKPAAVPSPSKPTSITSPSKPSFSERIARKVGKIADKVSDLVHSPAPTGSSSSVNGSSSLSTSPPSSSSFFSSSPPKTSATPTSASSSSVLPPEIKSSLSSAKKELKAALSNLFSDDSSSSEGKELGSVSRTDHPL